MNSFSSFEDLTMSLTSSQSEEHDVSTRTVGVPIDTQHDSEKGVPKVYCVVWSWVS